MTRTGKSLPPLYLKIQDPLTAVDDPDSNSIALDVDETILTALYAVPKSRKTTPANGENHVINWPPLDPDYDTGEVPQWWNQSSSGIDIATADISATSDRHSEGLEITTDGSAGGENLGILLTLADLDFIQAGSAVSIGTRVWQASGSTTVTLELYDSTGTIASTSVVTSTAPQDLILENESIDGSATTVGFRITVDDDSTTVQGEPIQWNRGPKLLPWRLPTSWFVDSYEQILNTNPGSTSDSTSTSSEESLCFALEGRATINGNGNPGIGFRLAPAYASSTLGAQHTRVQAINANATTLNPFFLLLSDDQQLKWSVSNSAATVAIIRADRAHYWGCAKRP